MSKLISFKRNLKQYSDITKCLPKETISKLVSSSCSVYRHRFYDPLTVLGIFLGQIISNDGSCRQAVVNYIAELVLTGKTVCSASTGAYCQARKKLPLELIKEFAISIAEHLEKESKSLWKWKGRVVKLVDGTTVIAPDTKSNQKEFPQSNAQKKGLGFPIIRIVGVFSLATGCLIDFSFSSCKGKGTGERSLLKKILNCFNKKDIALVDRYYTSVDMLLEFKNASIDFVGRSFGGRIVDFNKGQRLGFKDHVTIIKGKNKTEIKVREVEISVNQPGFRVKKMILVTSLLDVKKYSKDDLAELYKRRWNVELDFRSIKSDLGMDILRSKTTEMLIKEMWMYMLAYNVVRSTMWQCAYIYNLQPRELSFKASVQNISTFLLLMRSASNEDERLQLFKIMIHSISPNIVGKRPNRYEPRAKKYRGKTDTFMTIPREEARQRHWPRKRNSHHKKASKQVA